jgi:hypothetical protein
MTTLDAECRLQITIIMLCVVRLSVIMLVCHNAERHCHYAECPGIVNRLMNDMGRLRVRICHDTQHNNKKRDTQHVKKTQHKRYSA